MNFDRRCRAFPPRVTKCYVTRYDSNPDVEVFWHDDQPHRGMVRIDAYVDGVRVGSRSFDREPGEVESTIDKNYERALRFAQLGELLRWNREVEV